MKKVVALAVASLALLASSALSEEFVLKCKWVARESLENQMKLVEGEEFDFPVDVAKGFFHYLENGMTAEQKQLLSETGKKFMQKIKLATEKGNYTSAGLLCKDKETNEKVLILYSK
jgi:hypothetical protein